jgi:uncharacterized alkaline shock family protein YloU
LVDGGESKMSESEGQRSESPLLSERGATTISGTVVSSIAGIAAQEVEGVHMGGGGSRTASGVLGSITGSESKTSGISVDVGRTEVAIDLKMGVEYNKHILRTVEEVRHKITERVETMTGLRIKELNATITDITFPEKEERRRLGSRRAVSTGEDSPTVETSTASETAPESEETGESEPAETIAPEPAETSETETTETPDQASTVATDEPETEAVADDGHAEETTEVRTGDTETIVEPPEADVQTESEPFDEAETRAAAETPEETGTRADDETSETTETSAGPEVSAQDDAETRRRRRAEERARRRRRRQDS